MADSRIVIDLADPAVEDAVLNAMYPPEIRMHFDPGEIRAKARRVVAALAEVGVAVDG